MAAKRKRENNNDMLINRWLLCNKCMRWRSFTANLSHINALLESPQPLTCCDVPEDIEIRRSRGRAAGIGGSNGTQRIQHTVPCTNCIKNRMPELNEDTHTCCVLLGNDWTRTAHAGESTLGDRADPIHRLSWGDLPVLTRAQLNELLQAPTINPQSGLKYTGSANTASLKQCICGGLIGPDDEIPMIECDGCQTWFHEPCVGVDCTKAPAFWSCDDCCAAGDVDIGEDELVEPVIAPPPETSILCHVHPRFLLLHGDYAQLLQHFPSDDPVPQLLVSDPPSGMCGGIYDWDQAVVPWDFWLGLKDRLVSSAAVVLLAGASQFGHEMATRNRDVNNILLRTPLIKSASNLDALDVTAYLRDELSKPRRAPRGSGNSDAVQPAVPVYKYSFYWLNHHLGYPIAMHNMPLRFLEDIPVFYRSRDTVVYHPPAMAIPSINPTFRSMVSDEQPSVASSCKLEPDNVPNSSLPPPSSSHQYYDADLQRSAPNFLPIPFQADEEDVRRRHPHRKPRRLLQYLIETYSDPEQVVFDPFMGSGTSGEASLATGRRFIGTERHAPHFETAVLQIDPSGLGKTIKVPVVELGQLLCTWGHLLTRSRWHTSAWDGRSWNWNQSIN